MLVHGGWADASSWDNVIAILQHEGYTVDAPPNPLRGLASDSAYLASYLSTISGPIVLVGHSYGGAVITNAAYGNANVKALVYVDAFEPAQGESLEQLTFARPGSCLTGGGNLNNVFNFVVDPLPTSRRLRPLPENRSRDRLFRFRCLLRHGRAAHRSGGPRGCSAPLCSRRVHGTVRTSGLGDHPVLGGHRHPGPGDPSGRADVHGATCSFPGYLRQGRAPVDDHSAGRGGKSHQRSSVRYSVAGPHADQRCHRPYGLAGSVGLASPQKALGAPDRIRHSGDEASWGGYWTMSSSKQNRPDQRLKSKPFPEPAKVAIWQPRVR